MENASEALKMAGAVIIFVLAISIIILAFGQVRESVDTIIDYRDRETEYMDGSYYYIGTEKLSRNVNLETIIPSIFRAYLENYKIVFDGLESPIYKIKNKNGVEIKKYTLDLETNTDKEYNNVTLANNEAKVEFLRGILYHDFGNGSKAEFQVKFNVNLDGCEKIYSQLSEDGITITEHLGIYYQNDNPNVPDVNKTEKRIITYKIN